MAQHFLKKGLKKIVADIDSPTLHYGFEDKEEWCSSGNFALNRMMSGSYYSAFCYGQTQLIGGVSGSGKSLILATAAKQAQDDGAFVIWIDCENATKRPWLTRIGLKTGDDDDFDYIQAAVIDNVKSVISDVISLYDTNKAKTGTEQKIFIVIDSYSMMMTAKQMKEALDGTAKGDQGQHAKQIKDLVKAINALIVRRPILVAGIVHTMESQDQYSPDEIILGGRGAQYIASTVLVFSKYKLKAKDADSKATGDKEEQIGIKCKATVRKSRYTRPDTSVDMQIVFGQGVDPYSGIHDLLLSEGIIKMPTKGYYSLTIPIPGVKQPDERWRKKDFPGEMADKVIAYLEEHKDEIVLAPVEAQDEADIVAPEE